MYDATSSLGEWAECLHRRQEFLPLYTNEAAPAPLRLAYQEWLDTEKVHHSIESLRVRTTFCARNSSAYRSRMHLGDGT